MPTRRSISFLAPLLAFMWLLPGCTRDTAGAFEAELRGRLAAVDADVGFYFRNLETGDSLLINPDFRMHAASMMKVPVMIQLYRDHEAGRLGMNDSVLVVNEFRSIVDSSTFSLSTEDDSELELYNRIGTNASVRELVDLMITYSSNLATNIVIELADARRVTQTMRDLGADSIEVLRGVQDIRAYERGLSNTTTARDLGAIFGAIAEHRAASGTACEEMLAILERQEFNDGIPAGLPESATVAHKTGLITRITHDGGVVTLEDGTRYVLVVLTRGIEQPAMADTLIADLSQIVYRHVTIRERAA